MKKVAWMIVGMAVLTLTIGGFAYLGKTSADRLDKAKAGVKDQSFQEEFSSDLPLFAGMDSPREGNGSGKGVRSHRRDGSGLMDAGVGSGHGRMAHPEGHGRMRGDGHHDWMARRGDRDGKGRAAGERPRTGRSMGAAGTGMGRGRHLERIKQTDPERYERLTKIRELAEEYRTTAGESRKKEIEKELRPLVEEELKIQHENNKERIERLEEKLKEMKRILKDREENWDQVVDYTIEDITGQNSYLKAWPGSRMRHHRARPER